MSVANVQEPQLSDVQTISDDNDTPTSATITKQLASQLSRRDAAELAARRTADARLQARLHGWKAIVIWYALWSVFTGIGAISALFSGQVGAFFVSALICALCATYARYLFHGGRRRVWFVVW
jgi:membrane protein YqaA with SNARE-associated domain